MLAISEVGGIFHIFDFMARALFTWLEDGPLSLRLTSALLGVLTLPAFYGAVRHYTHGPGALLGTLLLALSPWHIWASRSADTWIVLPLLICVTIWSLLNAYRQVGEGDSANSAISAATSDRRWWGIAAIASGLLIMEAVPLLGIAGLWILAGTLVGFFALLRTKGASSLSRFTPLLMLVGTLAVAAPTLGMALGQMRSIGASTGITRWLTLPTHNLGWWDSTRTLLETILWGGSDVITIGLFTDSSLLSLLTATLTVLGILYFIRRFYNPKALLALLGLILFGLMAIQVDTQVVNGTSLLLPVSIFLFIGAAVALDQLLYAIQHAWRGILRPAPIVAVALIALLFLSGREAQGMISQLSSLRSSIQTPVNAAIGRYLAACINEVCPPNMNGPNPALGQSGLVFAPPSVVTHSETQLQVGDALDVGRIRPLGLTGNVLMQEGAGSDLLYLVPNTQEALLDILSQLYPNGISSPYFASEEDVNNDPAEQIFEGQQLFTSYQVLAEESIDGRGLKVFFTSQNTAGSGAVQTRHNGPLNFSWNSPEAMARPFSVVWQGTLLVPEAGSYTFSVELDPPPANPRIGDLFTLRLDDILVLDTSSSLTIQPQTLAQGAYHLEMNYRGYENDQDNDNVIANVVVRWQRPDGVTEVIPAEQLFRTRLPYMGLLGTYYPNEYFQEPALYWRKDLIVDAETNCLLQDCGDGNQLQPPYSVRWQGKLAATRAGEYMLASVTEGWNQIFIDGRPVIDNRFSSSDELSDESGLPGYQESLIYLDIGWHNIDVRYVAQDSNVVPQLHLLWQPPGGQPAGLDSRYLAPIMAEISTNDVILPPKTDVLNSSFVDESFVLSVLDESRQPSLKLPPANLPPLALEPVWQTESICGNGDDQLNYPHGIALDLVNERIYVADTANLRVVAYTLEGEPDAFYTSDAFEEPFAVSVTNKGQPFVLDSVSQQIFRIDLETEAVEPIPLQTGFYRPRGFDVHEEGTLFYVADTGGARVVVINDEGREVAFYGGRGTSLGLGQPGDVLVTQDVVWAVTTENGRLWRLDSFGDVPQPSIGIAERSGSLDGPRFAGLPSGDFFLSDPARKTIFYHAANGQPLSQFAYANILERPVGVAAAQQDGQVYLAVSDSMRCSLSLWQMPRARLGN